MNLRGGWAVIRKSLLSRLSRPGFFWIAAIGWLMGPLVYMFVWTTAAKQGAVGGFERDDFAFYYLTLILVNQLTNTVSRWEVGLAIRFGVFSSWLLRPLPPIFEAIGVDLAVKLVCLPLVVAVVIVLGIVFRPMVSLSLPGVLAFALALILAFWLRFVVAYVLSLLAFWSERFDALTRLHDTFLFLFAGQVVPTALLPGVLQQIGLVLPYYYMLGFPIEVLMGRLSPEEMAAGFGWQFAWLGTAALAHQFLWRRGLRRYTAVGG